MTPLSLPPSLSQYSEENMMDPYNLAICFGPTLMSVPEGHDQVSCQAHVNELIKTIIIHHDTIFPGPQDLQGPIYTIPGAGDDFWWVCMWGGSFRSDKSSEVAIWIAKASETAGNVLFNCYLTRGGLMMTRRTERKRGGGVWFRGCRGVMVGAQPVCSAQGQGTTRISLPSITQEIKVPPDHIIQGEHSMHTVAHITMHTRAKFQFNFNYKPQHQLLWLLPVSWVV